MQGFKLLKKQDSVCLSLLSCQRGWEVMLLLFPPSGFYHILKAMLKGPINGFWLSPSAEINIELQERLAWWLGKYGGCYSLF